MIWRAYCLLVPALGACNPQIVDAVSGTRSEPPAGGSSVGAAGSLGGEGGSVLGGEGGVLHGEGGGGHGGDDSAGGDGGAPGPVLRGDALIHRYTFDGTGTLVWDSKGGAHGTTVNTELDGSGILELGGLGTEEHVDLPDGLVSGLSDATFELWLTWHGGNAWQRAFDFGSNFLASNGVYNGARYLFLTPSSPSETLRAVFTTSGPSGEIMLDAEAVSADQLTQLAVVIDDENDSFALYRNGVLEASTTFEQSLSALDDVNNWLGRSQFETDAELGAALHDFRIYDVALSAEEIQRSFEAGPMAALEP